MSNTITRVAAIVLLTGSCAVDGERADETGSAANARFGQTPVALADLVGTGAAPAEDALIQRGYQYRSGGKSQDSAYSNWEEQNTGECVIIRTRDGHYESITYGAKTDCESTVGTKIIAADALVSGTGFNAIGKITCFMGGNQPVTSCQFGVSRHGNGNSFVSITKPDGNKRLVYFENGQALGYDHNEADDAEFRARKLSDLNIVRIGQERYEIPDAVIFGD